MSTSSTSQPPINPFADPAIPTLANVLAHIPLMTGISKREKTERATAIRTVAKAIGLPLSAIPAHPGFLRMKIADVAPARVGLRKGSWSNAKSLLGKVLREQGVDVMPGRYLAPMSAEWRRLYERLPDRGHKISMSRLFRFFSTQDLAPNDVTEASFEIFGSALREESLVKKPHVVERDARTFWNKAAAGIPGWPPITVEIAERRVRYPEPEFLKSLEADLQNYRCALTADLLDPDSTLKRIKPISADHKITLLRRLGSAAVLNGVDVAELDSIRALISPKIVRAGLLMMRSVNGKDLTRSFDLYLIHALSAARHWAKAPENEIQELSRMQKHLNADTYSMSDTTERVLRDLNDPAALRALLQLPANIYAELRRDDEPRHSHGVRAETALAIAILLHAPIRPKNLAAIDLERHIVWTGVGKRRRRHLRVPGDEVKNGEDLEFPLKDTVCDLLDEYMDRYRPMKAEAGNMHLFPAKGGRAKRAADLSRQIGDLTLKEIGVRATAHRFRAIAGKILLDRNPTSQEIARQVLGHRDVHTTTSFYAPLQRDRAIDLYDDALEGLSDDPRASE